MRDGTFITQLCGWLESALSWEGTFVILTIVALVLHHRHYVLSYGTRHLSWSGLVLLAITSLILPLGGWRMANSALIALFLVAVISELHISAIGRDRRPIFSFNNGFLIALLSIIHPGFLLLLPLALIRLNRMRLLTWRHTSALLLGTLSPWVVGVLFFAPATTDGINNYLLERISPLWEVSPPSRSARPTLIGLCVGLIALSFKLSQKYGGLLQRHRHLLLSQLMAAWVLALLFLLYRELVFFFSSAFYLCVLTQYSLSLRGHRRSFLLPFSLTLLLTIAVVALQWHVGLPS